MLLTPRLAWALSAALAAGCSSPATRTDQPPADSTAERRYLLEQIDDVAVVQLYADGFASLPLREKTLIWHLSQAALAGRDIYIDQRHRSALEMRGVLEAILTHAQNVNAETRTEIQRYTKLFWINNGPYNSLTSRKFVLNTSPAALAAAAKTAATAGAVFPTRVGESLDALLARLQPMFFDPAVDPIVTNKTPEPGADPLAASANNLYAGVTLADLQGFTERYGLNSRLIKRNGQLVEEVYKIDGKYGPQITAVVRHLESAIPFAPEPTAAALRALIQWYRTGDAASRRRYDLAWVQDRASMVDTINGFIEVYMDPRGVKGSWEGLVFYVNREKTGRIQTFAKNAQWFEDNMPFDPRYRKPLVQGIVANAIDVVMATGEAGPTSPGGINLPNDQQVREQYGSKSVSLSNVLDASNNAMPTAMRDEFAWTPEEVGRAARWSSLAGELITDMHEVIGHASGRQAEGRGTELIKQHFSALEEGRAELVGLYFIGHPKLVELGIVPAADQEALMRTAYEGYVRGTLMQLRGVREGTQLTQDHMRTRQMIVGWLRANTKAVEERTRDGKRYLVMTDPAAFRDGVGRLLAEVQRIKSEGDGPGAARLFETYGITFDPLLRDEVVRRVEALNPPSYGGFVMPKLTPVVSANGAITDVTISYPMDLAAQMLEWSGATQRAAPRRPAPSAPAAP